MSRVANSDFVLEPDPLAPRRPVAHVSPPQGWLNDPNGLFHRDGVFHAFYQHFPGADVWGPMHWRHAISADLVHWADQGIVLAPDDNGFIFSGSIVVDMDNTSGLGHGSEPPVVAAFTHHQEPGPGRPTRTQSQSLAYSRDGGWTWRTYDGNPVVASDRFDFRDPKVIDMTGTGWSARWLMVLAAGDRIELFRSDDLLRWDEAGEFVPDRYYGFDLLECPDLLRFGHRWIMVFSADIKADEPRPFGMNGTYAVPGRLVETGFEAEGPAHCLDVGPDFYAAQTYHGYRGPDGQYLIQAWMNNWVYARTHPSAGTRGLLSAPRLVRPDADDRLHQRLAWDHQPTERFESENAPIELPSSPSIAYDLLLDGQFTLTIDGAVTTDGTVDVSAADSPVQVKANGSGVELVRSVPGMPALTRTYFMERADSQPVRVLIDHGSIELFTDDGLSAMTALVFAGPDWSVAIEGRGSIMTMS